MQLLKPYYPPEVPNGLDVYFKMRRRFLLRRLNKNIERRIYEHNEGKGAKYTARRRPVEIVFAAEFANVADAYAVEKQVQGWSRKKREALIRGDYEALPALARKDFEKYRTKKQSQDDDDITGAESP